MKKKTAPQKNFNQLRRKVGARTLTAKNVFENKHPHARNFFHQKGFDLSQIRRQSTKLLTAGTLAGALLLMPPKALPVQELPLPTEIMQEMVSPDARFPQNPQKFLADNLAKIFPQMAHPVSPEQERKFAIFVTKMTGVPVRATLEGEHLNTFFGMIGAEQHLPRFPGDTIAGHDEFRESGITPGRGAWGYFATSNNTLTQDDIQREKYYVAVQTLYLPDWPKRFTYLRDWYKYRKVMVLNPINGKAVVAVVGDSGPAAWTGKHFGGSPEVMYELGLDRGMRKGAVFLLFVDDPENKIKLGPVDYSQVNPEKVSVSEDI